MIVELLLG